MNSLEKYLTHASYLHSFAFTLGMILLLPDLLKTVHFADADFKSNLSKENNNETLKTKDKIARKIK